MQRATIADLTADAVIYRDLEPCDPALPRLATLQASLKLSAGSPPRKRELAYAQVIQALCQVAQAARNAPPLSAFVVIGDTENDRLLAAHLRILSALPVYGFIGEDRPVAPEALHWHGDTATATRWHLLKPWAAQLEHQGVVWARTALLLDIDKTLLGPRGRSDGAIDDARAEGALTVATALLPSLDVSRFRRTYSELCHKEWYSFTLDNQDYVVATALLIAVRALDLAELRAQVEAGESDGFAGVLAATTAHIPADLMPLHAELRASVAAGDMTPFKAFRRAELTATLERMADGRLTLCDALFALGQRLKALGVLCFAASDKPAESALPSPAQVAAGMLPLHRTLAVVE